MIIGKNAQGYGYKYTDLAQIHKLLEEQGLSYQQYVEPHDNGNDYIMTVLIDKDGLRSEPVRGCKIPDATLSGKSNPAQEYGSAITYARRYSLLMAYGLATTDDDAESLTVKNKRKVSNNRPQLLNTIYVLIEQTNTNESEICAYFNVDKIQSMTTEDLNECVAILEQKKK